MGEVQYKFERDRQNRQGRSTQVMVACQCVSTECEQAVLVRPVTVFSRGPGNKVKDSGKRTCLYEAVEGKFSDCHSELLRVSSRAKGQLPDYLRGNGSFDYAVLEDPGNKWSASGQRGWTRDCLDTDISSLPTVDISKLNRERIASNVHTTEPGKPQCKPPANVQYYRSASEEDGQSCAAVYSYAAASAAHLATQADEIAVGNLESSYSEQIPSLVSNIELALSCGAAALGILVLWTMSRKHKKRKPSSYAVLTCVVMAQGLSFALEGFPLHAALYTELAARQWKTIFAFADATLSLAQDQIAVQGTAFGSVLVLTTVVGEVQYKNTREELVGTMTALFDLAAAGIIVATIWRYVKGMKKSGTPGTEGSK